MILTQRIFKSCLIVRQVFYFLAGSIAILMQSCSGELSDPQQIVDQAIARAGGDKFLDVTIEFDFRDRHYVSARKGGVFSYERIFKDKDTTITVHDFLNNDGFIREKNGQRVMVADSMAKKYSASVNSVVYFALLPYGLNDPSVNKKFIGSSVIEEQPYYKVEITFGARGGEDHEDVFHYWIHKKNFTVDYFSYSFKEDGVPDVRFRKAINPRTVGSILFQDHINYKPVDASTELLALETLFVTGQLKELSRIELKNILVK